MYYFTYSTDTRHARENLSKKGVKAMHKVLSEIKEIINKSIREYLPDVRSGDLEENGNIYYMNGKNGTEFDWYVNEHISDFIVFYNDEANLGAVKLTLYVDGNILIYVYGDKGNTIVQKLETAIDITEQEMLGLAVLLKKEADDKKIFDKAIDMIDSDIKVGEDDIAEFRNNEKFYAKIIERRNLFNRKAIVSAMILREGYKVGYMLRFEPRDGDDSGWQLLAGNEDDNYINNVKNLGLVPLGYVCELDPDILKYIDQPVGTNLIRISSHEFEADDRSKKIFVEKR